MSGTVDFLVVFRRCVDQPLRKRFVEKIDTSGSCWLWTGWIDKDGYGRLTHGPRGRAVYMAHRLSYEWAKGDIPAGLTIDHVCRQRACVRPDHLQAVTRTENVMRGLGAAATNARKVTCKRGHPFDGVKRNGRHVQRTCSVCLRITSEAAVRRLGGTSTGE